MNSASRIALVYFCSALLWVGGSDWFFASLFPDRFAAISLYKGWAFVLVTSAVLYVLLVREFFHRDRVESRLRDMAVCDQLTGLLNRSSFLDDLDRAVSWGKRTSTVVGVIFIDLDGFKAVNDAHGHHVGDELLVEAARRLAGVIRSGDVAARFGGDEFVVLVQGDRTGDGTERLAQRLLEVMRVPFNTTAGPVSLTASIGFSLSPLHAVESEPLLRAADMAMYRAKSMGKDALLAANCGPA